MISNWINPENITSFNSNNNGLLLNDKLPEFGLEKPAARMMFKDIRSYLPDDILCKVDRASMGVSLETRTPFLDPEVINLSMRLPNRMKIRNGYGKWALRQVLYKYVPRKIIDRPKEGFMTPIGDWLRGPLLNWAKDLISEENLNKDPIFNPEIIHQTFKEHLSGDRDWTSRLWPILMFQSWKNIQR